MCGGCYRQGAGYRVDRLAIHRAGVVVYSENWGKEERGSLRKEGEGQEGTVLYRQRIGGAGGGMVGERCGIRCEVNNLLVSKTVSTNL